MNKSALLLVLACCATAPALLPINLVEMAKQNELAAIDSAGREQVLAAGVVSEISNAHRESTEVGGYGSNGSFAASASKVRHPLPYVELTDRNGLVVICYLMKGERVGGLKIGQPASLSGRLDAFLRTPAGVVAGVQLNGCTVR